MYIHMYQDVLAGQILGTVPGLVGPGEAAAPVRFRVEEVAEAGFTANLEPTLG
jgi:hypothetical protein